MGGFIENKKWDGAVWSSKKIQDQNLVSVIMPAHNSERFISQSIKSVISQTYTRWELLVCSDSSSDNTTSIVEEWARLDPRIRLLCTKEKIGPGKARNLALTVARGRWIAFLDSDDIWDPEKLRYCLDFASSSDSALVFTAYQRIGQRSEKIGNPITVPKEVDYHRLLRSNVVGTSTAVVDRRVLENFSMVEEADFDDYATWLKIARDGHKLGGLPLTLTQYRVAQKSFSSNKLRSARYVMAIYRDIERLPAIRRYYYFMVYGVLGTIKTVKR